MKIIQGKVAGDGSIGNIPPGQAYCLILFADGAESRIIPAPPSRVGDRSKTALAIQEYVPFIPSETPEEPKPAPVVVRPPSTGTTQVRWTKPAPGTKGLVPAQPVEAPQEEVKVKPEAAPKEKESRKKDPKE